MVFYGPFGLEEGDMGSIFGISWSMYNGYFPHRDFVYIKPAFSPFFHSLPLYLTEEYAYLINRYLYYAQVFGYSYLASSIAVYTLKIPKKHLYFIAIIGALVSVHNYPPMPWNTVDGIFFSVLGLFLIVKHQKKMWPVVLGAFFLFLGALCKQSFYFFPPLVALFLAYRKEFKPLLVMSISGLVCIGLFLLFYWQQDALDPFITQIFSFTPGSSLINTGVRSYYLAVKFNIIPIVFGVIAIVLIKRLTKPNKALVLTNLLIVLVFIWLYYKNQSLYQNAKYGIIHLLWLAGLGYSAVKSIKDQKYTVLILMFALSWCASISNGYNTPIDFSTPMFLVVMLYCLGKKFTLKKWSGLLVIGLYLGTFYFGYQNPYREQPRSELIHHLGDVFPRLKTINTNPVTYAKFAELKALSNKYNNFTIMPSMTLGHYVTDTKNPIGVDWVFNHHLADQLDDYIQQLSDKKLTIFIENFENHYDNYEETSLLTMHVVKNWKLVERNEHFRVYQRP